MSTTIEPHDVAALVDQLRDPVNVGKVMIMRNAAVAIEKLQREMRILRGERDQSLAAVMRALEMRTAHKADIRVGTPESKTHRVRCEREFGRAAESVLDKVGVGE